jgi:hypothetical protein
MEHGDRKDRSGVKTLASWCADHVFIDGYGILKGRVKLAF